MNYKPDKMTIFASKIVLLTLLAIYFSACGSSDQPRESYVYSDPTTGYEVELRPSNYKKIEALKHNPESALNIKFENPRVQVRLKEKTVRFSVTKIIDQKSEQIELLGTLDDSMQSWLSDSKPTNNHERLKGYARCLNTPDKFDCPEMYVDVYYNQNGEIKKQQFIADPYISPAIETITQAESKTPILVAAPEPPVTPTDEETSHGEEENLASTGSGAYTSPTPNPEFLKPLELPKETPTKNPTPEPTLKPDLIKTDFPFNFELGGIPKRRPYSGAIAEQGTLLPLKGDGFKRISADHKAYTSGFLAGLLKEGAKQFVKKYPECEGLTIRNLSQPYGGVLKFDNFDNCSKRKGKEKCQHKSHQNGLDADIAYLPLTKLESVLTKNKLNSKFNYTCNYEFLKYLNGIKLPDGKNAIYSVFVHTTVKRSLCLWTKEQKIASKENTDIFKMLFATSDAHYDHMHIRLRCPPIQPPLQQDCWQEDDADDGISCKS